MPALGLRAHSSSQLCQVTRTSITHSPCRKQWKESQRRLMSRPKAEPEATTGIIENPDSEAARKKAQADKLRAAEKFMVIGQGSATCKSCGYEYRPENGDPDFPIPRGMNFEVTPEDYVCPVCGSSKQQFVASVKVVAGFAENQKYGLGTNGMTGDQKLLLIYGSLLTFFALFIAGYGLQ
jgi:rubredoxin